MIVRSRILIAMRSPTKAFAFVCSWSRYTIDSTRAKPIDDFLLLFVNDFSCLSIIDTQILNAKLNYRLGENDRIFVSAYTGRDVFGFNDEFGFDWGNTTATFRWNHIISEKLFSNTSFTSE